MTAPAVLATALHGWRDSLTSLGCDPDAALSAAGLASHSETGRAETGQAETIPLNAFADFAEHVGTHSRHPSATWALGLNYSIDELGAVGDAVLSARTLGSALRRLADHFDLLQDTSALDFEIAANVAVVSYRILDPDIWPRHHDALFTLGIVASIIRLAIPDAMQDFDLGFESDRRETGLNLSFNQICFGCDTNSITLPVAMLDRPMPVAPRDCDVRALGGMLARKRQQMAVEDRLASLIYASLPLGEVQQDDLANRIGMSSRTMRRRLAEGQTSFQHLLDACRMREALLQFQTRPHHSIAEIALRLGYAEHANFTRAFTRWAGMPPQRFRAEQLPILH